MSIRRVKYRDIPLLSWNKAARAMWRKAVRELPILVPARYPVVIRRVKLADLGDCEFCLKPKRHFRVRINRDLPPLWALDYLIHEHAHAVSWHGMDEGDHQGSWESALGRCYRAITGEH